MTIEEALERCRLGGLRIRVSNAEEKQEWTIFDFSVAACNAVCGGISLHDGRVSSAVISFLLSGALVALGIDELRRK